jgi:hypothetical protein
MAFLTTKEIYDLDNSMVAAQNVHLGTVLNGLLTSSGSSGLKVVGGSFTPSTADTVVASGLTTVDYVVCSLGGAPTSRHQVTTASAVGGNLWFSCWSGSTAAGGAVNFVASSGSATVHFTVVQWLAQGT